MPPTVRGVRAGESVLGAEKTVALGTGLARERRLLITGEPPKQAEDRKKPNPSACTGLAEHLLPRRHGLIQSFPRGKAQANFVRKSTLFQVTVSEDGQHFSAVIGEHCARVDADDMGQGGSWCCHCESPYLLPDFEDSPAGPIIAIAG